MCALKIGKVLKSTCDWSFIKSQEDIFRLPNHKSLDIRRIFGICSKKLASVFAIMNLNQSTNTEDFLELQKVLPGMVFHRLVLPRLPFRLFHFSRLSRSRAAFTLPFRFKWDQHDFSLWPTTPMLNVYFDFLYVWKYWKLLGQIRCPWLGWQRKPMWSGKETLFNLFWKEKLLLSLPRGKIRWDGLPSDTEETAAVIIFKKFPILEIKLDIFKEQTNEIVSPDVAQWAILSTPGLT